MFLVEFNYRNEILGEMILLTSLARRLIFNHWYVNSFLTSKPYVLSTENGKNPLSVGRGTNMCKHQKLYNIQTLELSPRITLPIVPRTDMSNASVSSMTKVLNYFYRILLVHHLQTVDPVLIIN
jgi:hypothetical protein